MRPPFLLTAAFGLALTTSVFAAGTLWTTDYEAAKKTATSEGKDLLVDFTGSDWCGWCIKLRKEVFDLPAFSDAAPKNFVLVELDFPQDKSKVPPATQEQNAKLQKEFAVRGFPTILLLDAAGRPYAQTGYQPGGPELYLKHLDELRQVKAKRDEAWKKAETAEGTAKAKFLAEGLKALDPDLAAAHYKTVVAEIAKLDPKDEQGVTATFTFKADLDSLRTKLQEAARKGEAGAARKEVDDFITAHPKASVRDKQEALMALLMTYRPPKDNETVLKLMEEVKALDATSDSGKRAESIINQVRKMIESDKAATKDAPAGSVPATKVEPAKTE